MTTTFTRADTEAWKRAVVKERYLAQVVNLGPLVRWPASGSTEIPRRLDALMEYLGVKATPRGILRLAAWLLSNPGAVTSLQMPLEQRPTSRVVIPDQEVGAYAVKSPPSDANAAQIRLFHHYVGMGLSKIEAATRTAADTNAERKVTHTDASTRRKDASAESVKILVRRYKDHPLPDWCEKVDQAWERRRWMERLERAALADDPYLARVERLTEVFDAGRCTPEAYRRAMLDMIDQRIQHAAYLALPA